MGETSPKIFEAISNAMADVGAVAKEKFNAQGKFNYRGIDDVMNALHPTLCAHGLFLVPEVLEHKREERARSSGGGYLIYSVMKMRYTLYAQDGSSICAVVIGEGMDVADKSSNKAMAVAMKYALFQIFCIPTEEMAKDDPDGYMPGESTKKPADNVSPIQDPPAAKKSILDVFREKHSLSVDQFAQLRAAVIAANLAEDVPSKDMTPDKWEARFRAIELNYFPEAAQ